MHQPPLCVWPVQLGRIHSPVFQLGSELYGDPLTVARNEACLTMLREIGSVDNIPQVIARAKDKNDPFRLMGFGHRVYKNYDPRAKVMRETCYDVLKEMGKADEPLFRARDRSRTNSFRRSVFYRTQIVPEC